MAQRCLRNAPLVLVLLLLLGTSCRGKMQRNLRSVSSARKVIRLAALGDVRSCDLNQLAIASATYGIHERAPLDGVILLGDNMNLQRNPSQAFEECFEMPYSSLLDDGVPFYAVLGNHDRHGGREEFQTHHALLNMNGKRYYSKVFGDGMVEVFFLDSNTMKGTIMRQDVLQIAWLKRSLRRSDAHWKIIAMHHPLYATAKKHPSDPVRAKVLEPIFVEFGVNLVLSGHNHIYERLHPIDGIHYITAGSGGELRRGDLLPNSPLRIAGNDEKDVVLVLEFTTDRWHLTAYGPDEEVLDEDEIPYRWANKKEQQECLETRQLSGPAQSYIWKKRESVHGKSLISGVTEFVASHQMRMPASSQRSRSLFL